MTTQTPTRRGPSPTRRRPSPARRRPDGPHEPAHQRGRTLWRAKKTLGTRLVGLTVALGVATLAVLGALAVFHVVLASGQYKIAELEERITNAREAVADLRYEIEVVRSPATVNELGAEALGLQVAPSPVHVSVSNAHIAGTRGAISKSDPASQSLSSQSPASSFTYRGQQSASASAD